MTGKVSKPTQACVSVWRTFRQVKDGRVKASGFVVKLQEKVSSFMCVCVFVMEMSGCVSVAGGRRR